MKRMILITLLSAVVFSGPLSGQDKATHDGVLFTLPLNESTRVSAYFPEVKLYHRFPEAVLLGASHQVWDRLRKAGFDVTLVDDQPWSKTYAVIAARDVRWIQQGIRGLHVIQRWNDHLLVTGSASVLNDLRRRDVSVVELEKVEIPWLESRAYLPAGIEGVTDFTISEIIARVSDSSITANIQGLQNFGTRYCTNANRDSVFRWLRNKFLSLGIADVVFDSFQYSGTWQKNVVATIPGSDPNAGEIIVGGHFDSYSSNLQQAPGADDNASGTAAALEMARVLMLVGYQPTMTLRFMGFAAEEVGLKGSAAYALKARQQNRDIKAMLNYDMIANRNQAQTDRDVYIVWYPGSEAQSDLHAAMMRMYTTLTPVLTTSYRSGSDSYSFYQQSYNSVFCIERDFSPYYHSPNDLLQYLEIPYAREVIQSGLATLLTLEQLPPTVPNLSVRDRGTGTALFVQWDSVLVPDLYRYKVQVGTSPGAYTASYLQTGRSRLITGLTAGTPYYIGVSIVDLAGREGLISEGTMVPRSVPLAPAGVTTEGLASGVRLEWLPNQEMDLRGYNVYRSPMPTEAFIRLNVEPIVGSHWLDSLVTGPSLYFMTAVDSTGNESAPSDTVSGSPLVGVADAGRANAFRLLQNFPNPFNPATTLRYELGGREHVYLAVYDLLGREVAMLVNGVQETGEHSVTWNAMDQSSGVYLYLLRAGPYQKTGRMVLIR